VIVSDAVLLVLGKKGFYSVTPSAETGPPAPAKISLDGGHSYLGSDHKTTFEVFADLG
jgi:hypothetical protein